MFKRFLVFALALSILQAFTGCATHTETNTAAPDNAHSHEAPRTVANSGVKQRQKPPIPAFMTAEEAKDLPPTLSPDLFESDVKAAYAAVREIPKTIAQLPCYCHCDRSIGHKSLHSCFEDRHASVCDICMNSALKALKLQKEQKMSVEQIRAELIKEYGG
ncbi:MAG: hypothetical protein HS105_11790 [Chloracidobacterium sp.]|nr:hypothetical protein [Chloracidobacterium sp.]MCC6825845.1 hypothetical protein [Acidobacteriota bacterium]MCO5334510.1 PCYCGC domain-containing protein [Pyrinomonadaceae bacterium]